STFDLSPTTKSSTLRPASLSLDLFAPPSTLSTVVSSPSTSSGANESPSGLSGSSGPSGARSAPVVLSPPRFDQFAHVRSPGVDRFRVSTSNADSAVVNSPGRSSSFFADIDTEKDVRAVVMDILNYILYEEQSVVERKKSMLLTTLAPPPRLPSPSRSIVEEPEESTVAGSGTPATTPLTPSRMLSVADALSTTVVCEDDVIVRSIVSSMVRETVKAEKLSELKAKADLPM
ncbi:hypothetical protein PENTCL1PPCAC_3962, partial [Pristionchus entomophagus]